MYFLQIRVGLRDIVADDPESLKSARDGRVPHVGGFHASLHRQRTTGDGLMQRCQIRIVQTLVAGKVGRETTHIRSPLYIVLPAQGIDAGTRLSDVAGGQSQITERDDSMAAPSMFRHAETMAAERGPTAPVESSRLTNKMGRHAGYGFSRFRRRSE